MNVLLLLFTQENFAKFWLQIPIKVCQSVNWKFINIYLFLIIQVIVYMENKQDGKIKQSNLKKSSHVMLPINMLKKVFWLTNWNTAERIQLIFQWTNTMTGHPVNKLNWLTMLTNKAITRHQFLISLQWTTINYY